MASTPLHPSYNITEGLKRAKIKPLNYSQVTVVQQDPDENPLTFLQFLKDAIQKHTTVNPESHRLSIQSVYCNSTSLKRKKKIKTP
jgi:hypothetical protein